MEEAVDLVPFKINDRFLEACPNKVVHIEQQATLQENNKKTGAFVSPVFCYVQQNRASS